jgi:hypothetical protein
MKNVLLLTTLLAAVACSRETESSATSVNSAATVTASATSNSVAAVAQTPGKHAVVMRFLLEGKPTAGAASQVRLELAGEPGPIVLRLEADGISVEPAMASLTISDSGDAVMQSVAITPQAAGISEIRVRVRSPAEDALETVYAIPLLIDKAAAK